MIYLLLGFTVALLVACCRLAVLLGREREATESLRWKLLGANLQIDALRGGRGKKEEWPEEING